MEMDVTPREALDRIAALTVHDADDRGGDTYDADEVRAVLAEVSPETGGVLDRDQAGKVLWEAWDGGRCDEDPPGEAELDRLAAAVRPAAIDRAALEGIVAKAWLMVPNGQQWAVEQILALVRPVAGVTLTPEEADDVEAVLQLGLDVYMDSARGPRLSALAARLEAAS